jgi:L-lactate utilization protein LutC
MSSKKIFSSLSDLKNEQRVEVKKEVEPSEDAQYVNPEVENVMHKINKLLQKIKKSNIKVSKDLSYEDCIIQSISEFITINHMRREDEAIELEKSKAIYNTLSKSKRNLFKNMY